jgi:hypothetical protein
MFFQAQLKWPTFLGMTPISISKVKDKDLTPPLRKTFPANKATEGAMGGRRWF